MGKFGEHLDKVIKEQLETEVDPTASQHQTQRTVRRKMGAGVDEAYITRDNLTDILQGYISVRQFKDLMKVLEDRVFKPLEEMQQVFK